MSEKISFDISVVDAYQCSRALERFHADIYKPVAERVKKNEEHMATLSEENRKNMKPKLDPLIRERDTIFEFETTVLVLIRRHESLASELSKYLYQIREKVIWEGEIPKDLMDDQVKILNDLYKFLEKTLIVLNL